MKKSMFFSVLVMVFTLLVLAGPVSAEGQILEVGSGYPYATIQLAVDDAQGGDTILVYPGYYDETVTITKSNLTLLAQDEGVFVEPHEMAGFHVTADRVTIRGFEIYHGWECAPAIVFEGSFNTFAENYMYPANSGCIGGIAFVCNDYDGGSDYNTIENNEIYGAQGLKIAASTPDAVNKGNVVRDNLINGYDYGLFVANGKGFSISGNEVYADNGNCISIWANNSISQGKHLIMNNTATGCGVLGIGSGIELYALNSAKLNHNQISENVVSQSYVTDGIYLHTTGPDAAVNHNQIHDNTVYHNKYGIYLGLGADNNHIKDNLVETNHDTGIVIESSSNRIANNDVLSSATDGIAVMGDNNLIIKNTALYSDDWDLADYGGEGNKWLHNEYETANWE